jgi:alkyl hydroperoxide reductase subunit AhpF
MKKPKFKTVDYQEFCPIDTPLQKRRALNVGNIFSNSIKCLDCGEIIRSKNLHDVVTCDCKRCSIDGGSWYSKIRGDMDTIEVMAVPYNDIVEGE